MPFYNEVQPFTLYHKSQLEYCIAKFIFKLLFLFHTKRDETPLFNFVSGYSSWADYLQSMSKDGTWGDHLVLLAAANCYQTPIRVISSLGNEIVINPEHPVANLNPLVLGHIHEEHYVSLHPRQGKAFFLLIL